MAIISNHKIILPIEKPEISCYLHHTHLLIPIMQHQSYYDWLYSNFIQLKLNKSILFKQIPGQHLLNFWNFDLSYGIVHYCPILNYQIINSGILKELNNNIDSVLKIFLEKGNYINLYLDDFYISSRRHYQKEHFVHDHLIYGFDMDGFYTYGYDNKQQICSSLISYSAICEAFTNNDYYPVNLFSPKSENIYSLDLINIANLLRDYLDGHDTSEKIRICKTPGSNAVYGIKIYEYLFQYYEYVEKSKQSVDLRIISVLTDHKKCMYNRVRYLCDKGVIQTDNLLLEELNNIDKQMKYSRNLQMKYNISKETSVLEKSIEKLKSVFESEQLVMEKLYAYIKFALDK